MIKPIYDRLIVKKLEVQAKSSGGILLTSTPDEKTVRGVVLCTPKPYTNAHGVVMNTKVKVGEVVIFMQHAGVTVKDGTDELLIINETDVLGIVSDQHDD